MSLLIYGLPIIGLMLGALITEKLLGAAEIVTLVVSLAGLLCGLTVSAKLAKVGASNQYNPQILSILGEPQKRI